MINTKHRNTSILQSLQLRLNRIITQNRHNRINLTRQKHIMIIRMNLIITTTISRNSSPT